MGATTGGEDVNGQRAETLSSTTSTSTTSTSTGPGCERVDDGALVEPVSAVTSFAFVVAAAVVVLAHRGTRRTDRTPTHTSTSTTTSTTPAVPWAYVALVAGIGLGSFVQHGPDPAWSDPAHDLPLLATLCFLAADGVAALTGRARRRPWWVVPTAVLMVPVVLWPRPGDLAQVAVTVVAGLLLLARARREPAARRRVAGALALLAVGGLVGTLSRTGGPLCDPDSLLQGHALWHVLAAAALAVLAPLVTPAARH